MFVIRGEGGLKLGQHFVSTDPRDADGVRQREFLSYVLGLDWTVNDNLMANFQFFQNVIFNKPKDIPDEAVNNIVSVFLRADFINETLFPELIALYGINFGELLIRPQIEYQLTDYLSVTLGADFFIGPRSGFFGQYAAPARRLRRGILRAETAAFSWRSNARLPWAGRGRPLCLPGVTSERRVVSHFEILFSR